MSQITKTPFFSTSFAQRCKGPSPRVGAKVLGGSNFSSNVYSDLISRYRIGKERAGIKRLESEREVGMGKKYWRKKGKVHEKKKRIRKHAQPHSREPRRALSPSSATRWHPLNFLSTRPPPKMRRGRGARGGRKGKALSQPRTI